MAEDALDSQLSGAPEQQDGPPPTTPTPQNESGESSGYDFDTQLPDLDSFDVDAIMKDFPPYDTAQPDDNTPAEPFETNHTLSEPTCTTAQPSDVPDALEIVKTTEMPDGPAQVSGNELPDADAQASEFNEPADQPDAHIQAPGGDETAEQPDAHNQSSGVNETTETHDANARAPGINERTELPESTADSVERAVPKDNNESYAAAAEIDNTLVAPTAGRNIDLGASILQNRGKALAIQQTLAARFRNKQARVEDGSTSPPVAQRSNAEILLPAVPSPRREPSLAPSASERDEHPEAVKFRELKAVFLRKKNAGTLHITEEIEFMKIEAHERARQRKAEADAAADRSPSPDQDEESALFVEDGASSAHQPTYNGNSSDEDERAVPHSVRTQGGRNRKRKSSLLDDVSTTTGTTASRPRKIAKSSKKSGRRVGGSEASDSFVNDVLARHDKLKKKTKQAKAAKTAKTDGKMNAFDKRGLANVNTVRGTNIFRDTERNAHRQEQPGFTKRRRADALAELIASVPEENRKVASADRKFLDEACKMFNGTGAVHPASDGNWTVKGMKSTLKHYQILGAAFMRKRENEERMPRGGILADEMGLGKTVEMLANIVNGKPRGKTGVRCTLLVASPALCNQWAAEIKKHCFNAREKPKHGLGSVVQHRAGYRLGGDEHMDQIQETIENADICLTTYGELCKSYPKAVVPPHLTTAVQKDAWWKEFYEENRGVFHRIKFLRIVLDEAQMIKNHKGHTSLACRAVQAQHHWAITGTPIMNRLSEFYPYFKFLREPSTGSFKLFKENFCSPDDPEGASKLAIFLRKIMIRRTHVDTLFGARLLDLPQPTQRVVYLSFNDTERQIYEIVKTRFVQRINTIAKQENGVAKHYNHIWTMILRLRQLCAHPLLIQETIVDLLKREDFEKLNALAQRHSASDDQALVLLHLRHVLAKSAEQDSETVEAGTRNIIYATQSASLSTSDLAAHLDGDQIGGRHGTTYNFGKYLNHLANSDEFEQIRERSTCCACRQPPDNPHVTSCHHIYCFACIEALQHHAARHGRDSAVCSECGLDYTEVKACQLGPAEYQQSSAADGAMSEASSIGSSRRGSFKKGRKKDYDDPDNDWIGMKGEVLPSTKTMAIKAQIQEWFYTNPEAKIIIYTQFLPVIRIMGKVCQTEKWGFQRYTGAMSQEARKRAIENFDIDPGARILLASLRCGGLGLNLTMATHVILIDPWWNSAVEQQAFCRVFRIGQTRETKMTRFVVENTIDAAMMQMKEKKEQEIDEVMENPNLNSKVSPEELMRLFGQVGEDEHGRPFIFPADGDDGDEDALRFRDADDDDNEDLRKNDF